MGIDRRSVVRRHNPRYGEIDIRAPLSVGNGEITHTVDVTGLQTLYSLYSEVPLCTQCQTIWHSFPREDAPPADRSSLSPVMVKSHGREIPYYIHGQGQEEDFDWLRKNAHRPNLFRLSLETDGGPGEEIPRHIAQELDLYSGIIHSSFAMGKDRFSVRTACHPHRNSVATEIGVGNLSGKSWHVVLRFPYGDPGMGGSDWKGGERHRTGIRKITPDEVVLERTMDNCRYLVGLRTNGVIDYERTSGHQLCLKIPGGGETFSLYLTVGRDDEDLSRGDCERLFQASEAHWREYWEKGGMIDLSGSTDPRAGELERRTILSQYLTAIQCSGSLPPQETGLTCNSWFGKFHLEMHYWHAAHFPLWNRPSLLERSMGWYLRHKRRARDLARSQGFRGLRWPKMTDPACYDSPSNIGPLIIWQQPHPIMFAELLYRCAPEKSTLERYEDMVFGTAEFMADFVQYNPMTGRYNLGPGLIPAQENHHYSRAVNPTFELEYWNWGLRTACLWKRRMNLTPDPLWEEVLRRLAPLPRSSEGYLAHRDCPDTFRKFNYDHPSMLCALGMLPGELVDRRIMEKTLTSVRETWQYDRLWGWDYPVMAMTAARLNKPEEAIDLLLFPGMKNIYLPNGHNRQGEREDLPLYLPGNGAFLMAVALMSAGWEGRDSRSGNPGFPENGKWQVRWEDIRPLP